jgi:hypothetical protein
MFFYAAAFAALILFFFRDIVFFNKCLLGLADIRAQHFPFRSFVTESLRNGRFPLWTGDIFFGFPLFAESQTGVLYPINLALIFLPVYSQITASVILHFLMSGVFMAMFLSLFTKDAPVIFLGTITWVFSGLFIQRIDHINVMNAFSWIPLFFFILERYMRSGKAAWLFCLAAATAINILSGHLQTTVYLVIMLAAYYAAGAARGNRKITFKEPAFLLLSVAAGAALAAVQVLPLYELVMHSARANGISAAEILSSEQLHPFNLINIIYPFLFGSAYNNTYIGQHILKIWIPAYHDIYAGTLALPVLIIACIKSRKDRKLAVYLCFIAAIILFSMGGNFFLNRLLIKIPGLSFFRNPARMLELYPFFLSALTVWLLSGLDNRDVPAAVFKALLGIFIFAFLASVAGFFARGYLFMKHGVAIKTFIENKMMSTAFHHYPYQYYYDKFVHTAGFILSHVAVQSMIAGVIILTFLLYANGKIQKQALVAAIIIVSITELFINGMDYQLKTGKEYYTSVPGTVKFLREQPGYFRILPWRFFENEAEVFKKGRQGASREEFLQETEMLQPNMNMAYHIQSYWGYDPLGYAGYYKFFEKIDRGCLAGGEESNKYLEEGFHTLNESGVKYILSPFTLKLKQLKYLDKEENIYIYENTQAKELVEFSQKAKIDISKWADGTIEFTVDAEKSGEALILNSYYPGWEAVIGDSGIGKIRQKGLFQALDLPAGKSKVLLQYNPKSFKYGLLISIVSLLIFIAALIFYLMKSRVLVKKTI